MEVNNPYIDERRELMLKYDKEPSEEIKNRLDELDNLNRLWIQEKLVEIRADYYEAQEKVKEIQEQYVEKAKSRSALYNEAIELSKDIQGKFRMNKRTKKSELVREGLVHRIRNLKKMLRGK